MATHPYPAPEPFVSIQAAAQFLSMPRGQVQRLAACGAIRSHNYGIGRKKYLRFRLSELTPVEVDSNASPVQRNQE